MKEFDPERHSELEDSPRLSSISMGSYFKVPLGYFDFFFQRLIDRLEAEGKDEEEMMADAPLLSSLKKEPYFQAPDDYFSTFEFPHKFVGPDQHAPQEAHNSRGGKVKKMSLSAYTMAIAATVILLMGLLWILPNEGTAWDDLKTEELYAMIEEEEIATDELVKVLGKDGLDNLDFSLIELEIDLSKEELSEIIEEDLDFFELEDALITE